MFETTDKQAPEDIAKEILECATHYCSLHAMAESMAINRDNFTPEAIDLQSFRLGYFAGRARAAASRSSNQAGSFVAIAAELIEPEGFLLYKRMQKVIDQAAIDAETHPLCKRVDYIKTELKKLTAQLQEAPAKAA